MSVSRGMDYMVIYQGEPIGTIKSPSADEGMGMVCGHFCPAPAYEKVRSIFQMFSEALENNNDEAMIARYYQERDALNLSIITTDGYEVPTDYVSIFDYFLELGDDGYEAEFRVASANFFQDRRLWISSA